MSPSNHSCHFVSTSVSVISGEERRPLKIRMAKDSQEYIEHIKTDVRTCGLLVDDPAVPGTFKFGHKSFMEYLFASVIADSIIKSDKQDTQAILKTTKARIDKITKFPVSTKFLSEIIIQNNHLIPHDKNQYKSNLFIAKFIFNKYLIPKNKIPTFLPKIFKTAIIIPIYIIFLSKLPFIKKSLLETTGDISIFYCLFIIIIIIIISLILLLEFTLNPNSINLYQHLSILTMAIIVILVFNIYLIIYNSGFFNPNKLIIWIKLCKSMEIKDEILHTVIGSNKIPILQSIKFDHL